MLENNGARVRRCEWDHDDDDDDDDDDEGRGIIDESPGSRARASRGIVASIIHISAGMIDAELLHPLFAVQRNDVMAA